MKLIEQTALPFNLLSKLLSKCLTVSDKCNDLFCTIYIYSVQEHKNTTHS